MSQHKAGNLLLGQHLLTGGGKDCQAAEVMAGTPYTAASWVRFVSVVTKSPAMT